MEHYSGGIRLNSSSQLEELEFKSIRAEIVASGREITTGGSALEGRNAWGSASGREKLMRVIS